jgi:allantoinase
MSAFDLVVRRATVVSGGQTRVADVGVTDGHIAALTDNLTATAKEEFDATGLHLLPGFIDSHVHFNDPGRAEWEGIETGSRALAAGGGVLFFDMPLNSSPPTINAESFRLKLAAAQGKSYTDFAFWGGLVPGNHHQMQELADCGVVGFKAFMSNSGIEDFPCVNDDELQAGMLMAAKLRLPIAVHAESEEMTRRLASECLRTGKSSVRDYLASRPIAAELDAIARAIALAGETGCSLHIVHVSSDEGVNLVARARRQGVDVSCETCPHYLLLSDQDMEQIGAIAKCAPPLRPAAVREQLVGQVIAGNVNTIGSDHSPSPPAMKCSTDFFNVWGGISSVQHTAALLVTALSTRLPVGRAAELCSELLAQRVAERFQVNGKRGRVAVGMEASFVVMDLNEAFTIRTEDLMYRHAQTPYAGKRLCGRVLRTFLRGQTVFADGKIPGKPIGQFVRQRQSL